MGLCSGRRGGGASRHGGGGGGARQRQRLAHRGLRLWRHPRRVHRAPEPDRHRACRRAGRGHCRERRHAAAPPGLARRDGARPAGRGVHADPGQRSAVRADEDLPARASLTVTSLGWWGVPLAVLGGAIRVSTPFLFVSLGECITERSGRINLVLRGILVMGAMTGYALSYATGNPWLGVLAAAGAGALLGVLHGLLCSLPRVN